MRVAEQLKIKDLKKIGDNRIILEHLHRIIV